MFDSHHDLDVQYGFEKPLNEKIRVAKGIIYKEPYRFGSKIEQINRTFNKLPKDIRDSCKEVRIFEIATDDPTKGSMDGAGGFYSHNTKAITIGLRSSRSKKDPYMYSYSFLKESTIHEGAHALDFNKLSSYEKQLNNEQYNQDKRKLQFLKEYGGTNETEFFAEGYTNAYLENWKWFEPLTANTKRFFKDIIERYRAIDFILDFIMIPVINKEINGIKFSYESEGDWIFGIKRIPEEISQEEAEIMVNEGKAQFENVDKYIDFGEEND